MTLTQITEKGIKDGEIVNADINASAAIAGTKVAPNFGSQNIVTTGSITGNDLEIDSGTLSVDASNNRVGINETSPDYSLHVNSGSANSVAIFESTDTAVELEFKDTTGTSFLECRNDFRLKNSSGEKVRIDSSGNVGIGTTSPVSIIHATGSNSATGYQFTNTNTSSGFGMFIKGGGTTADRYSLRVDDAAGNERFRVNANGRVGIGVNIPAYILDVVDDGGPAFSAASNSTQGQISIVGKNSGGSTSAISRIKSHPDGSSNQSHLAFETRNSSSAMVERMRIDSGGRVLIGADTVGSADGYTNNFMVAETSGSAGMSIQSYNSASSYSTIALGDRTTHNRGYIEQRCGDNNQMTIGVVGNGSIRFSGRNTSSGNIVERARFTSDGLCFNGDSAANNALYDYEEGTWGPVPTDNNNTFSYGQEYGRYTKIGNVIHVTYAFNASMSGTSGYALFINLPFQVKEFNNPTNEGIGYSKGTGIEIQLEAQQGQSRMKLRSPSTGSALTPNNVGMTNNVTKTFRGAITYLTTS